MGPAAAIARRMFSGDGVDGVDSLLDEELKEAELAVTEPGPKLRRMLQGKRAHKRGVPDGHVGVCLLGSQRFVPYR